MPNHKYTLAELAKILNVEFHGDENCEITSIAPIESAQIGQLTFLDNSKYRKFLPVTKASIVILANEYLADCPCNALITKNPYYIYAKAAELFTNIPTEKNQIHPTVVIGNNCQIEDSAAIAANVVIGDRVVIGKNTMIGAGCVIGDDCVIGDNTRLWPNVTIYYGVKIGNRNIIHSGVVIGGDGFGFAQSQYGWHKVPQLGGVHIHNDVEIGANTTIDRGALADTIIEDGVKLDNQIQIGHNVRIGSNTIIAGCSAIAGSAVIGKNCILAGSVGIAGHLTIADNVILTAMTGVSKSITESGVYSGGVPPDKHEVWLKNAVSFGRLSEMLQRIKKLEQKV